MRHSEIGFAGGVVDGIRRAAIELGAFLEIDAPGGGHNPTVLDGEHMGRFVAHPAPL